MTGTEDLNAAFVALFEELENGFAAAPAPSPVHLPEVTTGTLAAAEAVAIMYGWTCRVVRTGRAVLLLRDSGYAVESAPLIRSMIEHAIGLFWLQDMPSEGYQALLRGRQQQLTKFKAAQEEGWDVPETSAALIEQVLAVETEEASAFANHYLHVKHQAQKYGQGMLYEAWLIETWSAHAGLTSAQAYLDATDDGGVILLAEPKPQHGEVTAAVASTVHTALTVYNLLLPGQPLSALLQQTHDRFMALSEALAQTMTPAVPNPGGPQA